jgi:hypothetical protein
MIHCPIELLIAITKSLISSRIPGAWIFLNSKPKKDRFWVLVWKKEHRSGFCFSGHFGRSGVQKALKKRSKLFGSVLELYDKYQR